MSACLQSLCAQLRGLTEPACALVLGGVGMLGFSDLHMANHSEAASGKTPLGKPAWKGVRARALVPDCKACAWKQGLRLRLLDSAL